MITQRHSTPKRDSEIQKYKNKTSLNFFKLYVFFFLSCSHLSVFLSWCLITITIMLFLRQEVWDVCKGRVHAWSISLQFVLWFGLKRRALRVRFVTVVKRNSSWRSTLPLGSRFMKCTSCCVCVVREPFLGRPRRLKPRYQPLYLADTNAV